MRRSYYLSLSLIFLTSLYVAAQQKKVGSVPKSAVPNVQRHVGTTIAYDHAPFDENIVVLPKDYRGHDIESLVLAVKKSDALNPKSEFESTAAYQSRLAGFHRTVLDGRITPDSIFAFVLGDEGVRILPSLSSQYDADSQILKVSFKARVKDFLLADDRPKLSTIDFKNELLERTKYIASNAFGAKAEVTNTYSESYGIAFSTDDWLFGNSSSTFEQSATFNISLSPGRARLLKPNLRALFICKLREPWFRHTVSGTDPTIDKPYETLEGMNYLQVLLDEVWLFDSASGQIIRKLSEPSLTAEAKEEFAQRLKQFPVIVEIIPQSYVSFSISTDGSSEQYLDLGSQQTKTVEAHNEVIIRVLSQWEMDKMSFKFNGEPYKPAWIKEGQTIGTTFLFRSAAAHFYAPNYQEPN